MAGGIFTDRPFELNPKCVVFASILMILYYLSTRYEYNPHILPVVFIISYLSVIWYDKIYMCNSTTTIILRHLVFSLLMIGLYYLSSQSEFNPFMLFVIFIVSYIAMAWYDWLYYCESKMYSGDKGIISIYGSIFKPQYRDDDHRPGDRDEYLRDDQDWIYRRNVYLFHLLAIVPLFLYVGIMKQESSTKVYIPLLIIGIFALLYHGMRATNLFIK